MPKPNSSRLNRKKLESKYRAILEEMRRNDEELKVSGQKYLEYQLSWFRRKYDEENDITLTSTSKEEKELITFLEFHAVNETQFFSDKQMEFRKEFTRLHDKVFLRRDPNKERIYGLRIIKEVCEEYNMNYAIETDRETSGDTKKHIGK